MWETKLEINKERQREEREYVKGLVATKGQNDLTIVNLSNDVFERRTSTGSGPFLFLDDCFAQIFSQIVTIIVKKLSNTNFISSRHIKREKSSLPVDVRGSKTPLLKLTNIKYSYLADDAALCVILSCVREATYDMPFPSAPRSKTCGNSVTINICHCPINFGVFCSALNSHLTMRSAKCIYYRSKFLKFFCKIFQPRLIFIFS